MDNAIDKAYKASRAAGRSPCYQCSERKLHCHDNCPRYLEWKLKIEEARKVLHQEFELVDYEKKQRGVREVRRYIYYDSTR